MNAARLPNEMPLWPLCLRMVCTQCGPIGRGIQTSIGTAPEFEVPGIVSHVPGAADYPMLGEVREPCRLRPLSEFLVP
jgi:hypothetical protein